MVILEVFQTWTQKKKKIQKKKFTRRDLAARICKEALKESLDDRK